VRGLKISLILRRDCPANPARKNEDYKLELPGTGERPGSSWASGCPEAGGLGYPLFLTEIKHDKKWMEWFRWKLEMPNMVAKSSKRTNGGLAMFWRRVLISM
jgi:hypothetical protein